VTPRVADDDCATAATRRMMTMTPTSDLAMLEGALIEPAGRRTYVHAGR
jgi:hypothetical protein